MCECAWARCNKHRAFIFGILSDMKSLKVPYFTQDTDYTCGPTSLQMVLEYYGVQHSEPDLAKQMKTSCETGTCPIQMSKTAVKLGFHSYVNTDASFEEIRFLLSLNISPIIRFVETNDNEDHYGVVISATKDNIIINDPWNGPELEFLKAEFIDRWTSNKIENCHRWLMAVSPGPLPLGRQFSPHE